MRFNGVVALMAFIVGVVQLHQALGPPDPVRFIIRNDILVVSHGELRRIEGKRVCSL